MSNEVEFRNLNQATELAEITENTKVVVLENGVTKKTDASNFAGGGSNDFVVTYTENDGSYSADKTYSEITAAIEAGKNVYAKTGDDTEIYIYILSSRVSGDGIAFNRFAVDFANVQFVEINHKPNNVISVQYKEIQTGE